MLWSGRRIIIIIIIQSAADIRHRHAQTAVATNGGHPPAVVNESDDRKYIIAGQRAPASMRTRHFRPRPPRTSSSSSSSRKIYLISRPVVHRARTGVRAAGYSFRGHCDHRGTFWTPNLVCNSDVSVLIIRIYLRYSECSFVTYFDRLSFTVASIMI